MLSQAITIESLAVPLAELSPRVVPVPRLNHVLFIVEDDDAFSYDFSLEDLYFSCVTIDRAWDVIEKKVPGIILISSSLEKHFSRHINYIRHYATDYSAPLILYSSRFDGGAQSMAWKYGFDDYYFGNLSHSFLNKIHFIGKIKESRTQNGANMRPVRTREQRTRMWAMKRAFDIAVSATALLVLSPVLLLIAIAIMLESRGPVLYVSKRAGNGYRVFDFIKFRSMRVGADNELRNLSGQNQYKDAVFFKIKNDPRVTPFGAFLRKTSLDELPQLINVLRGDMSLVGNRPLPLYEAEQLTSDRIAWRFLAPAGITGLWQITKRGRKEMSHEERIQLDMAYARKNSFIYDMKILLGTFPALMQQEEV